MSLEARLRKLEERARAKAPARPCPTCGFPRVVSPEPFATTDTYGTPCPECGRPRNIHGLPYLHVPVIVIDPRPLDEIRAAERCAG